MNKFYINQRLFSFNDVYYIYNELNEACFKIKSSLINELLNFIGFKIINFPYSIKIKDLNNNERYILKRKLGFLWAKYQLIYKEKILLEVKEEKTYFKPGSLLVKGGSSKKIIVKRNFLARNFGLIKDNYPLGNIKKIFSANSKYEIKIYNEEDIINVIAITVIIDQIFDE